MKYRTATKQRMNINRKREKKPKTSTINGKKRVIILINKKSN